jgi:metal-responsive CopG/Arc/MetJ family transcriptional regulator
MKTAISLPDDLFRSADALAERLGISRSKLFATAVAEFLAKHQTRKLTDRLNAVYGTESSTLEPVVHRAQRRSLDSERW